jgi:hypothetical protein
MSSPKEEANLRAFQCFLERLIFSSKILRDRINDNRQVPKVAIEGL